MRSEIDVKPWGKPYIHSNLNTEWEHLMNVGHVLMPPDSKHLGVFCALGDQNELGMVSITNIALRTEPRIRKKFEAYVSNALASMRGDGEGCGARLCVQASFPCLNA